LFGRDGRAEKSSRASFQARPAPIPNSNDRAITFAADRHVDGSSLASEANAIADDILDGAAEQFSTPETVHSSKAITPTRRDCARASKSLRAE
jgi:hypothetical protein